MKAKIFAIGAAALLALLVLNAPISTAQQDAVTAERSAEFSDIAKVVTRLANVLDNVKSLPYLFADIINALCGATLSEGAMSALFTGFCGVIEMSLGSTICAMPVAVVGLLLLFFSYFCPPVIGLLWGIPVLMIIRIIAAFIGATIGPIAAEAVDSAIGLSEMCGGICTSVYFALTPLWDLCSMIVEPIVEIISVVFPLIDSGIDAFMSLVLEPLTNYGDAMLRELYGV